MKNQIVGQLCWSHCRISSSNHVTVNKVGLLRPTSLTPLNDLFLIISKGMQTLSLVSCETGGDANGERSILALPIVLTKFPNLMFSNGLTIWSWNHQQLCVPRNDVGPTVASTLLSGTSQAPPAQSTGQSTVMLKFLIRHERPPLQMPSFLSNRISSVHQVGLVCRVRILLSIIGRIH